MPEFNALNLSASALNANRRWMDTIADNLANAETTRIPTGGPFRRKSIVFEQKEGGVEARAVAEDAAPPRMVHDPSHPDADANGIVLYPNVNPIREMVDMMAATRAYEANVTAFNATKAMLTQALELGRA